MTNIFTLKTTRTDEECVCVNFTCTEALTKKPQLKWTHSILRPVCACVLVAQSCLTVRCSGLELSRLLCPWSSPGKNTGVGSQSFFPKDLPDPGIKLKSPALQVDSLASEPPGTSQLESSVLYNKWEPRAPWSQHIVGKMILTWNLSVLGLNPDSDTYC